MGFASLYSGFTFEIAKSFFILSFISKELFKPSREFITIFAISVTTASLCSCDSELNSIPSFFSKIFIELSTSLSSSITFGVCELLCFSTIISSSIVSTISSSIISRQYYYNEKVAIRLNF